MTPRNGETREEYLARQREASRRVRLQKPDRVKRWIESLSEEELEAFKERNRARARAWRAAKSAKERSDYGRKNYMNRGRARRFGLTPEQLVQLRDSQGGKCALCGKVPPNRKNGADGLNVDHRHDNGFVRGMLCAGCNRVVGVLDKDPDFLIRALNYARCGEGG